MKDYSQFIRDEFGFITSIKPNLETKTIEVYTSKNKKDRPQVYELNRENIQKLYGRLEKQYKLLIENKDSVLKQLQDNQEEHLVNFLKISCAISGVSFILSFLIPALGNIFALGLLVCIGAVPATYILKHKHKKEFEDMIETYNYFITNREEIEAIAKTDENVISDITIHTHNELQKSNKLVEEKLTDEQYTIQLIDRLPLKDLKEILLRYKISKALDTEPYFYKPTIEEIEGEPVFDETTNKEQTYEEITSEEIALAFDEEDDFELFRANNNQQNTQKQIKTLRKKKK